MKRLSDLVAFYDCDVQRTGVFALLVVNAILILSHLACPLRVHIATPPTF